MKDDGMAELSKLPRGDGYWDALEARMVAAVGPELAIGRAAVGAPWFVPLARGAWGLGAVAAAAAAVLLVLPPRATPAAPSPIDAVQALVDGGSPPAVAALLLPPDMVVPRD